MLNAIKTALFDRLEANTALPIYYDNIDAGIPTGTHLRPIVLPADTSTIGVKELGQEIGVFRILVYTKKGTGQLDGILIAEDMLNIFPRGLQLNGVNIDSYGSINASFFSESWQVTPVSFSYQHLID